jgi:hypothetical protein
MAKLSRINLSLLKRLVHELEESISIAEKKIEAAHGNHVDFAVEMLKAGGLCAGINKEASLLIGDINYLVQESQAKDLLLNKIASVNKGDKSNGN